MAASYSSPTFKELVQAWIATSNASDVLEWTGSSEDPRGRDGRRGPRSEDEYRCLVERSTRTYVRDWSDISLQVEYRMLSDGWRPAFVSQAVVEERREDRETICAELARRSVHAVRTPVEILETLTRQAVESIEEGRGDFAATLFSTALALDPRNPELMNNRCFCLLPDNPRWALRDFLNARRLGGFDLVKAGNCALAYRLLEKPTDALRVAEEGFQARERGGHRTYLWNARETIMGTPSIAVEDPLAYLCSLAETISLEMGEKEKAELWMERRRGTTDS